MSNFPDQQMLLGSEASKYVISRSFAEFLKLRIFDISSRKYLNAEASLDCSLIHFFIARLSLCLLQAIKIIF